MLIYKTDGITVAAAYMEIVLANPIFQQKSLEIHNEECIVLRKERPKISKTTEEKELPSVVVYEMSRYQRMWNIETNSWKDLFAYKRL